MATYQLEYSLSNEYCKKVEISTGIRPNVRVKTFIDLVPLTPAEREQVIKAAETWLSWSTYELTDHTVDEVQGGIAYLYPRTQYDRELSPAELVAEITRLNRQYEALLPSSEARKRELAELQAARVAAAEQQKTESTEAARRAREESERRAQAQREQLATWVLAHGTPSQQERLAAELLSDQEIVDAMREEVFAATADWPHYDKLLPNEICICEGGDLCEVEFESGDAESANEAEFNRLKELHKLLPAARITLRTHTGTARICGGTATRTGVLAVVQVGEFAFRREFAV